MAFCEHPVKIVLKFATSQSTVSQQQPMSQKSGVKSQTQPERQEKRPCVSQDNTRLFICLLNTLSAKSSYTI